MDQTTQPTLTLAFGLQLRDLYDHARLPDLDAHFITRLNAFDPMLQARLVSARNKDEPRLSDLQTSNLLIELAPVLEDFLGELFDVNDQLLALRKEHSDLAPLYLAKRKFVQRQAARSFTFDEAQALDPRSVTQALADFLPKEWTELQFAAAAMQWLETPEQHTQAIDAGKQYAAWAIYTAAGRERHASGVLFKTPAGMDPDHLVPHLSAEQKTNHTVFKFEVKHLRRREGFALTDKGAPLTYALDQANYCIWCHAQGRDSCRNGLKHKQREPSAGKDSFKTSAHGVALAGCPLEERISEFHQLKAQAVPIGALAVICIDNSLAAATGHRICNDCMKACIFQKQEAVNIPEIETRTLKDVLNLPWGFEIYSLLTRWNPLNLERPYPKLDTGKRVLVVGSGPAGFNLAHHLLNDGHRVVAIDGLKIEPLPVQWIGNDVTPMQPIHRIESITEALDTRVLAGFGGVAEYGITVRWDKNYLRVIRLLLERRSAYNLFGGVRLGGTITAKQAFEFGFDHIALAVGAGKPTSLEVPNGLARGVRAASDFLMALQLTGAGKKDSIANLQTRLPIVVIGGGLTAIDTATESLAYYVVQIEKFLSRYEQLCQAQGEVNTRAKWDTEEALVANEMIAHALAVRAERTNASNTNRAPNIIGLLQSWGGATIAYRKHLTHSPSYILNHEEIEKALQEGIYIADCLSPSHIKVDEFGAVQSIDFFEQIKQEDGHWADGKLVTVTARSVYVAAGTSPNTVIAREDPHTFALDGKYLQVINEQGERDSVEAAISKPVATKVLTHRTPDDRYISFFGDVHPSYFGNVVKAMASAKNGYPTITKVLARLNKASSLLSDDQFVQALHDNLNATVHCVRRLTPTIVEVVVKAPWAARAFKPGQFYRLQNYESLARLAGAPSEPTRLQMEGLALTGAWVDAEQGLLSTIVLEMGGSADLCAQLKVGEPVVLMGPTGTATQIPENETVVLVGGGLGNAVLFSIGAALRAAGCKVLYFAGYKKLIDRYKVQDIEAAADVVVWCSDEAPGFTPTRAQDKTYVGNIVNAIAAYANNELADQPIELQQAQRMIAIGSDRMMAAVARARHNELKPYLHPKHHAVGSINSPMQCMMKEICAQCLQRHVDPITGKESVVFSCFNQDQALDRVDWHNLNQRLRQNSMQEKLTVQWIKHVM
jgi:NADPH-dependent glutamate synthase beta subunit-like oxidoreductase/NAD(P)H-flavin reductase